MLEMTPKEKLNQAKIKLQETNPFFAYLIMHMMARESSMCPSMGVDKDANLIYNPEFVGSLSKEFLQSALAHEIGHVMSAHLSRYRKGWHNVVANIAADIKVNDMLRTEGFKLKEDWIVPSREHVWGFSGKNGKDNIANIHKKTMEEIYAELESLIPKVAICAGCLNCGGQSGSQQQEGGNENQDQQKEEKDQQKDEKDQQKGGSGGEEQDGYYECPVCGSRQPAGSDPQVRGVNGRVWDQHMRSDKKNPGEEHTPPGELSDAWKMKVAEAASFAKQRGKLSSYMQEMVDGLVGSRVDWRTRLLKFVSSMLPCDYSWRRPSRKAMALGIYLPSVIKEGLEVIFHIDSSGSIGKDTLRDFLSETRGVLSAFASINLTLIICDAKIQGEPLELTADNVPDVEGIHIGGRGGTSHAPVVEWIVEHKPNARVFVSLTDGYSDIESCYDKLPDVCTSMILLEKGSSAQRGKFEHLAEVIYLDDCY